MQKFPGCTIPDGEQEQYRRVMTLAQCLQAEPDLFGADADDLGDVVTAWFERMNWQPHRTLGSVLSDFRFAWDAVACPMGERPIDTLWDEAGRVTPPPSCRGYRSLTRMQLGCLCHVLQAKAGQDGCFFLGCRTAAQVAGVYYTLTARWLKGFVADGWLRLIERGDRDRKLASVYRAK